MNRKNCLILLFFFICLKNVYSIDSLKKSNGVKLSINANGFILSSITNTGIDPFYHASGLFNSIIVTSIGNYVSIPLRTVAEVWNFSESYENPKNMYFWAKPSVNVKVPVNVFYIDTFFVKAGDLGRVKQGQGLSLDYFESQGVAFNILVSKKINLSFQAIGYGWTGFDDIFLYGISYDSLASLRLLQNFESNEFSRILSADFSIYLHKTFRIYGEAGYNYDKHSRGFLGGIEYKNGFKNGWVNLSTEFRHYDKTFLKFSNINSYPYFNSLTALDKPVNNFRYYQPKTSDINALAARLRFKYFVFDKWFLMGETELIELFSNPESAFAYETALGYEVAKGINLNVGLLNKFFQIYSGNNRDSQMFSLHKDIWIMIKANYMFGRQF